MSDRSMRSPFHKRDLCVIGESETVLQEIASNGLITFAISWLLTKLRSWAGQNLKAIDVKSGGPCAIYVYGS